MQLPPLHLTNTATNAKELFAPLAPPAVGFYSCGPTVYNNAHIGNLATYVFNDLLKRTLRAFGYEVRHVMNITDVDDKMIRRSFERGITLQELGDEYLQKFLDDTALLNIEPPAVLCRATEHIALMQELIQKLLDRGVAYVREGSVYFSIAKFPQYASFAHLDPEALAHSTAPLSDADEAYEKDDVRDFALWKAWSEDDGDVGWDSPWGKGHPGWHIECSAMSMRYLGESFDLHTGAIDLIFPHHTNEIAQSEAATGKPFVRYWLHRGFVQMGGEKMAKRVGNVLLLADILTDEDPAVRRLEALAFRLLVLSSHYRSPLNFTTDILAQHQANLLRFLELADALERVAGDASSVDAAARIASTRESFFAALADDLNMPEALAALFAFLRDTNADLARSALSREDAAALRGFLSEVDAVLGVIDTGLPSYRAALEPTEKQRTALNTLAELRASKQFDAADALRSELVGQGLEIQQTKEGVTGKRRPFAKSAGSERTRRDA